MPPKENSTTTSKKVDDKVFTRLLDTLGQQHAVKPKEVADSSFLMLDAYGQQDNTAELDACKAQVVTWAGKDDDTWPSDCI